MTLAEVIADKGALGYFIQYLEARSAGALIRFYLDVECFRSAAHEDVRASRIHEQKVSLDPDCDKVHSSSINSRTEESKITVNPKENDLQTENSVHDSASAHGDAVRIFEKYVGVNASLPIPIEEDIRNSVALALCHQGDLDTECFSIAQNICFEIMEEE